MALKIISHVVLYFYTIADEFYPSSTLKGASLVAQMVKNLPAMWETWVRSLGWEDPVPNPLGLGRGQGKPLLYSCLDNPHGQRSLVSYSPWGCKELDTTE